MKNTRALINLSYKIRGRKELVHYNNFLEQQNATIEELEEQQLNAFLNLFEFTRKNTPYYSKLFKKLKLNKHDFKAISDLGKIPVLTKKIILENYNDFFPYTDTGRFVHGSTGGSTGEPLKYRMSIDDYSRGVALLYRGLERSGYKLGDKLAIIAGGSLVKNKHSYIADINNYILNFKPFSSYGMDEEILNNFYYNLKKWKPTYLRGYASSLALFADFCIKNNKEINFNSVFSTAEMLAPKQRLLIETAFNTKVFNNYGLNDGGISAYENDLHDGFIIDTERSILEIVEENKIENVMNQKGRILATSLYNYSFPFIRYDSGDVGSQIEQSNNRKKLINLGGRITDYIILNDKVIGSPILTILMGKVDAIKYQIIQKLNGSLEIRIIKGAKYDMKQELFISNSLNSNLGGNIEINFIYTDQFIQSKNKHKFIIKES